MLNIITNPHPTLRKKAVEIDKSVIPEMQKFFDDMIAAMNANNGLGLAANQVDVPKRVFVMNTKDGPIAVINPKISKKSLLKEVDEEGCLSIPGVFGLVRRHKRLTLTGLNRQGKKITIEASGLFARVVQHEVDHLDGVLFTDRTKKITKGETKNVQAGI